MTYRIVRVEDCEEISLRLEHESLNPDFSQ